MKMKDELIEELHKYENQWVAILEAERKIVGSGENAYQAKLDAEAKGYPEIALFKVRPSSKDYLYSTWTMKSLHMTTAHL